MKNALVYLFIVIICLGALNGAGREPLEQAVPSKAMGRDIANLVILPEEYDGQRAYPVIYLLHGWEMKYREWLRVQRELPELATKYGVILVCPDAGNSWYWDSPLHPHMRYETYVAQELADFIRTHYKTIDDRRARAITGLSMGGHGALWLAIRHQEVYGACGSMSGAVDIRRIPTLRSTPPSCYNITNVLGSYEEHPDRWAQHSVMTQLHRIQPGLAIILDCGTGDMFHEMNAELHRTLLEMRIPHDYISRPGAHNGRYWRNALHYQLLFFAEHFKRMHDNQPLTPA